MSEMNILIAIPCYQCEKQIVRLLTELDLSLLKIPNLGLAAHRFEIVLIENNGSDQTIAQASKTILQLKNKSRFKIFKNQKNYGLGGTHKIAFHWALQNQFTHLVFFHGDHQACSADILRLVSTSLQQNQISILGSRFKNLKLLSGYSLLRTLGNVILNLIYSLFTWRKISDLGSGLNLFSMVDIQKIDFDSFDSGFCFNMDLLLAFIQKKVAFSYLEIHWSSTDQISNAKALQVGFKALKALFQFKKKEKTQFDYITEEVQLDHKMLIK